MSLNLPFLGSDPVASTIPLISATSTGDHTEPEMMEAVKSWYDRTTLATSANELPMLYCWFRLLVWDSEIPIEIPKLKKA